MYSCRRFVTKNAWSGKASGSSFALLALLGVFGRKDLRRGQGKPLNPYLAEKSHAFQVAHGDHRFWSGRDELLGPRCDVYKTSEVGFWGMLTF
jgi:hypothetical protein